MTSAYLPRVKSSRMRSVEFVLKLKVKRSLFESDKVIFPERVLQGIMREYPTEVPTPTIFEIIPYKVHSGGSSMTTSSSMIDLGTGKPLLHCGVREYTCEDRESVEIPYWFLKVLGCEEGTKFRFRLVRSLPKCTFARVRPLQRLMAKVIPTPKQTLEYALRNFTALTDGQLVPVVFEGHVFTLLVEAVTPSPVGTLIDTHLSLDFEPFDELVAAKYEARSGKHSGGSEDKDMSEALLDGGESSGMTEEDVKSDDEDRTMSVSKKSTKKKKKMESSVMTEAKIQVSEMKMYHSEGGTIVLSETELKSSISSGSESESVMISKQEMDSLLRTKAMYFRCKIANPNFAVRIDLESIEGDCLIYVDTMNDKPSMTHHRWKCDTLSKKQQLIIPASDLQMSESRSVKAATASATSAATWLFIAVFPFVLLNHSKGTIDAICVDEHAHLRHVFALYIDQMITESTTDTSTLPLSAKADDSALKGQSLMTVKKKEDGGDDAKKTSDLSGTHDCCPHCQKWISKGAFMMHEARCARLNVICDLCGSAVSKSAISTHIHCEFLKVPMIECSEIFESDYEALRHAQLRHREVSCGLCGESMAPSLVASHQKFECVMRFVLCKWCGMSVRFGECSEHESYCGASTVECQMCGELCQRARLEHHLASEHGLNPTLESRLVTDIVSSTLGTGAAGLSGSDGSSMMIPGDGDVDMHGGLDVGPMDIDDLDDGIFSDDPVISALKRDLSHMQSVPDETTEADGSGSLTSTTTAAAAVWDFVCPFCQKNPPKSVPFPDHMAACSAQVMAA